MCVGLCGELLAQGMELCVHSRRIDVVSSVTVRASRPQVAKATGCGHTAEAMPAPKWSLLECGAGAASRLSCGGTSSCVQSAGEW